MYRLIDAPYEDLKLKETLEALALAKERAEEMGGFLVSEYDQHFLPRLDNLEGVRRATIRSNRDSGLIFAWECDFGQVKALPDAPYGVAVLIPAPGAELPKALQEARSWASGEGLLDYSTRAISIRSGETVITFPSVDIAQEEWKLLQEVNAALAAQSAGVLIWRLSGTAGDPGIEHVYRDGKVPLIRNEHAQGTVTGYARTAASWNWSLVYAGVVAHKTAIESLHATLMQKKSLSLDGCPSAPDGHFRMEACPLPEFGLYHAALISDAALPGKWGPQDETAYALVFKQPGRAETDLDALLETAVLVRLREVLPHPVKDDWGRELFGRALEQGLIDRLQTAGDCLAGARIHLTKDWTAILNDLLAENTLTV